MNTLFTILIGLLFGWLNAFVASKKGRDPFIWFILGFFFALLSLIVLYFLPPVVRKEMPRSRDEGFIGTTIDVTPLNDNISTHEIKLEDVKENQWYYLDDKRQEKGPISYDTLKALYKEGILTDESYLWSNGMPEWKRLCSLQELHSCLND